MRVPESTHSVPCCFCGQDHKEWLCQNKEYLCQGCGHPLQFEDAEYCMSCMIDHAEDQAYRWGEYR